jgi:hypothetical protein
MWEMDSGEKVKLLLFGGEKKLSHISKREELRKNVDVQLSLRLVSFSELPPLTEQSSKQLS